MSRPTESIYDGGDLVIALADVQHVERLHGHNEGAIWVITKHTTWSTEMDTWNNPIFIDAAHAEGFLRAWCAFRGEVDDVRKRIAACWLGMGWGPEESAAGS